MAKLHEILAIEKTLASAANKLLAESKRTLNKPSLFQGQVRKLTHRSDEMRDLDSTEVHALTTTVMDNLSYLRKPWSDWINVVFEKEEGNQRAKADLVIDGVQFAYDVPATTLLGMETKLAELRDVLDKVPTLPPGINWVPDPTAEIPHVYKNADTVTTVKEIKDTEFRTVAVATEQHPSQVVGVETTKPVGRYETTALSGLISPHEKAAILTRLDTLLRAVKRARMRANDVKTETHKFGAALFDYVLQGDTPTSVHTGTVPQPPPKV